MSDARGGSGRTPAGGKAARTAEEKKPARRRSAPSSEPGTASPSEAVAERPASKARPKAVVPAAGGPKQSRARKNATSARAVTPALAPVAVAEAAPSPASLTEEEQIESAKYLPRELPPRLFEEERFLFPETYGINRVRLLIKDPEWLFAHWDVDPASLGSLRDSLGERGMALSRLTLRIMDPDNGGMSVVLLPQGSRSWYVRTDTARRSYRAELGLTLPSGEFRRLAESNTVLAPRVGPSPQKATRVLTYHQAIALSPEAAMAASVEESRSAAEAVTGPWSAPPPADAPATSGSGAAGAETAGREATVERGGASDTYRR